MREREADVFGFSARPTAFGGCQVINHNLDVLQVITRTVIPDPHSRSGRAGHSVFQTGGLRGVLRLGKGYAEGRASGQRL